MAANFHHGFSSAVLHDTIIIDIVLKRFLNFNDKRQGYIGVRLDNGKTMEYVRSTMSFFNS